MRLTLDTNCLINLENRTSQHESVRALIEAHRARRVVVCVPAMAASENQRGGKRRSSYKEFEAWLQQIDAAGLNEIKPMGYWGIAFWNHAVYSGPESKAQERAIHDILHPDVLPSYADFCAQRGIDPLIRPQDRHWLNAKCDVQALWSHIHAGNDVFVTEDRGFLRAQRKAQLIALGAGHITTPDEAVARFLVDSKNG